MSKLTEREWKARWYSLNAEVIKAKARLRYKKKRLAVLEANKSWAKRNPDRVRKIKHEWQERNRASINRKNAEWRKSNPDKVRMY